MSQSQYPFENSGIDYFQDLDARNAVELSFDEESVKTQVDSHAQDHPVFEMKVISHAHDIFNYFRKLDSYKLNFFESLHLTKVHLTLTTQ